MWHSCCRLLCGSTRAGLFEVPARPRRQPSTAAAVEMWGARMPKLRLCSQGPLARPQDLLKHVERQSSQAPATPSTPLVASARAAADVTNAGVAAPSDWPTTFGPWPGSGERRRARTHAQPRGGRMAAVGRLGSVPACAVPRPAGAWPRTPQRWQAIKLRSWEQSPVTRSATSSLAK